MRQQEQLGRQAAEPGGVDGRQRRQEAVQVDGNNVLEVYTTVKKLAEDLQKEVDARYAFYDAMSQDTEGLISL